MKKQNLLDEVNEIQAESHLKWCRRYFDRIEIEKCIKISASKGYRTVEIPILSEEDEYIRNRLDSQMTIDYLKNRLGTGFLVKKETEYSDLELIDEPIIDRHSLIIQWK